MSDKKFVLASGSPRRKELMHRITDDFLCVTADIDEREIENGILKKHEHDALGMDTIAQELCQELALRKALAVQERILSSGTNVDNIIIIGSDTTVAVSDEILGKPVDRNDAVRMLRKESQQPQFVVTGVAFVLGGKNKTFVETTKVIFNNLDEEQEQRIQDYCDTPEPYDKAGAYGIQLYGDAFVKSIEGDYDNIVGFPVNRIKKELLTF